MQLCSRTVLYVSCCSWSAATVPWFTLRRCHHAKYCVRSLAAHAAWLRLAASCQLLLTVSSNGTVAHALAIATAPTIACALEQRTQCGLGLLQPRLGSRCSFRHRATDCVFPLAAHAALHVRAASRVSWSCQRLRRLGSRLSCRHRANDLASALERRTQCGLSSLLCVMHDVLFFAAL